MMRVLVVDDDFMVTRIHTAFVDRVDGFEVVGTAATAAAARQEIARLDPDLVLLDVHLPDGSGLDVLRDARHDGYDGGIIMITAAREAESVRAAAAGGAAAYLVKPFEQPDLALRLEDFRARRAALDAGSDQQAIDAYFARAPAGAATPLPKGLSEPTASAVLEVLRGRADLSAVECADEIGVARVTARRYLEHFVATGRAAVRHNYETGGRPERRYRAL